MITQRSIKQIFLIIGTVSMIVLSTKNISAQDTSNISFGVDPLKISENVVVGDTITKDLKIYNLKNTEVEYLINIEKFGIQDEKGTLVYEKYTPSKKEPEITLGDSQIIIPANSSQTVEVNFVIDNKTEPKEYHYVVFITPISQTTEIGGNSSFLQGKIGVLTFINVLKSGEILGELVHSGSIVEFNVPKLNLQSPVEFSAIVNNTGTVHYDAFGTLKIFNNSNTVVETIELKKFTVLPGTNRILEHYSGGNLLWNFGFRSGRFKGELNVTTTDGTLKLNDSVAFYVIPLIPILIGLGIIMVLIIGFVLKNKKVNLIKYLTQTRKSK